MIYILYPILVIINIIGTALTFPLAPILVLFKQDAMGWVNNATARAVGPRLVRILSWWQTPDNSLDGDAGFESLFPEKNWWSKVHWLWRNPFYGFAVVTFDGSSGMSYSGTLGINATNPGSLLIKGHGLFQWVYYKKLGSKCLYLNFGWNIMALVDHGFITPDQWHDNTALIKQYPATFAFSPRIV
jgi:hypothetical protein